MTFPLVISPEVAQRFPEYRAAVIVARNLYNGPSTQRSQELLREAQAAARQRFATTSPAEDPHLAAWRAAFSAFGVKPKKMVCSAEALIARVVKGGDLPAINLLVDAYNAVSVRYAVPCGGENLDAVVGTVRLKVADGSEPFDVMKDGLPFTDHPAAGEVVWADDQGVTCRGWNWRQGIRTRLTEDTTNAYFLFDALDPAGTASLPQAADELVGLLQELSPDCQLERFELGGAEA